MTLREQFEDREKHMLCDRAIFSAETQGRVRSEKEHDYRTAFQRDRDRILHSKSFRRLKHKTQVFLAPEGDHYRTRLTHTFEAAQIARTVARALYLNEDLVEAIALGHDLGHTPFGHAGEFVLNEMFNEGFRHAEQSLRVVDLLESTHAAQGLNLTFEVRDGILKHSKGKTILDGLDGDRAATLEGEIVSVCDAIAYINHDIDDAIRGNVIAIDDLPKDAIKVLGRTTSERINAMVTGLITGSEDGPIAVLPEVLDATNSLRSYLYTNVYPCDKIHSEISKAMKILRELYCHLIDHSEHMPSPRKNDVPIERHVVDLIAGMTDQYALHLYAKLFFPTTWRGVS